MDPKASGRPLFEALLARDQLRMARSAVFDKPAPHQGYRIDPDRVRGMMLGLAIGDALGNTTEGMKPQKRFQIYGEIRDYIPAADGRSIGLPSDDTQLAFWTIEHLLEDGGSLIPERLAERFSGRQIFGIGHTVRAFLKARTTGAPWYEAAVESAGNGALMRIAPVLFPHLRGAGADFSIDAALLGAVTHNDRASIAACVAFANMLSSLLVLAKPPSPIWWIEEYVRVAEPIERGGSYKPRTKEFGGFQGSVSQFIKEHVARSLNSADTVVSCCDRWYSGAYLMETVSCVLLILARFGEDPEAAMIRAVNDTVDNDTVGAIVGAAIGALHGAGALPARWKAQLLGRTEAANDGKVEELIDAAMRRFVLS